VIAAVCCCLVSDSNDWAKSVNEYLFIAFGVLIGFVNERSGAALVLLRGESL
jgi:hypothetical protein